MLGKKEKSQGQIEKENSHFAKAQDWDASMIQKTKASEKRAWTAFWVLAGVAGSLALTIGLMMPLKEKVPYVMRVDKSTGMTDVLPVAGIQELVTADEMQDKYWLSQYVRARETYDWRTVESDFINTRELSMPDVFQTYSNQFEGAQSLDKVIGDKYRLLVGLQSIQPEGNGIATVRFVKTKINNQTGEKTESLWIAKIGYEYNGDFKATEENRLVNPFGFKVTSYRVDPEAMQSPSQSQPEAEPSSAANILNAPGASGTPTEPTSVTTSTTVVPVISTPDAKVGASK